MTYLLSTALWYPVIFARWQLASRSWGRGGHVELSMVPFERAVAISYRLTKSDYCVISNYSAVICHRMSPTLKSTGRFWAQFGEEGVGKCKPNFNAKWRGHWTVICKKSCRYILPFEHNARTWLTDRQTDRPRNGTTDKNGRNRFQRCRLIITIILFSVITVEFKVSRNTVLVYTTNPANQSTELRTRVAQWHSLLEQRPK